MNELRIEAFIRRKDGGDCAEVHEALTDALTDAVERLDCELFSVSSVVPDEIPTLTVETR